MTDAPESHDELRGILYAGGAYVFWGFVPLYWRLLDGVGPWELTLHRILWCALLGLIVTAARGRLSRFISAVRTRRVMTALTISSVLIALNWTIYIYCVEAHRLVEASLGYYMTPLVSIALGVIVLGENISRFRAIAIALAGGAVVVQAVALGHVPFIAPALALSFGFYGYVRKLTPVDSMDGLTIETCLLLPITVPMLGLWAVQKAGAFPATDLGRDALLVGTGPLTAVPLVLFAASARRVRLTTLGFLQYFSPTITLLVATLLLDEPFTRTNIITFACVWVALVLVSLEGRVRLWSRRPA